MPYLDVVAPLIVRIVGLMVRKTYLPCFWLSILGHTTSLTLSPNQHLSPSQLSPSCLQSISETSGSRESPYQTLGRLSESSGYAYISRSSSLDRRRETKTSSGSISAGPVGDLELHQPKLDSRHSQRTLNSRRLSSNTFTKKIRDVDFPRERRRQSYDHVTEDLDTDGVVVVGGVRRASVPAMLYSASSVPDKSGKTGM